MNAFRRFFLVGFAVMGCVVSYLMVSRARASDAGKKVVIYFTGSTHAMLYQCSCPFEPDGGVARRATLFKQLRAENPQALFLDSGGYFGGGQMDEYTQGPQLDVQRSSVSLKAMDMMRYDAIAVGNEEFNFGKAFLEAEMAKNVHTNFLSCNLKVGAVKPSIVRTVNGVKVGVIGVTNLSVMGKAEGAAMTDPKTAVTKAVQELVGTQKANVIVVLMFLEEDLEGIKDIPGVNVIITGFNRGKHEDLITKLGNGVVVVRPQFQGRRVGKLAIDVKQGSPLDVQVEEMRVSDKYADDPEVLKVRPACFSDASCKKQGFLAKCENPGGLTARCNFTEAPQVHLTMIEPKECSICNTDGVLVYLRRQFPGLVVNKLIYPDSKEAVQIIKDMKIEGLPVFLLGKEADKEPGFASLRDNAKLVNDQYFLKQEAFGLSYFINRPRIKDRFDVFFSPFDQGMDKLLAAVHDLNPVIHFLAVEREGKFEAQKGQLEVEEDLRGVCVQKIYPQRFWDYLACRAQNNTSSWWDDCLTGVDTAPVVACAKGQMGKDLLRENIKLNQEIMCLVGPSYLIENQEVFGTRGVPTQDDFKKILKRK